MNFNKMIIPSILLTGLSLSRIALADAGSQLQFTLPAFPNNGTIPIEYALCISDPVSHTKPGQNLNPEMDWSQLPKGTQSLAIILFDSDSPVSGKDQQGENIPENAPRKTFYHFVLVDIPTSLNKIQEGQDSNSVSEQNKQPGPTAYGVRGLNDFQHGGYDGPCPPWNDLKVHQYHFHLYALDVKSLNLSGNFNAQTALSAMKGHILGENEWVGLYTISPSNIAEHE
jgi:Raf kinase inhibitor-like YbhB/YbcL family protein